MGQHDKPGQGGQQQNRRRKVNSRASGRAGRIPANPATRSHSISVDATTVGMGAKAQATRARGPLEGLEVNSKVTSPYAIRTSGW